MTAPTPRAQEEGTADRMTDDGSASQQPTDDESAPQVPHALHVQRQAPDRNLALELVRVTEAAAMAAGRWVGRGDKNGGDGAAVDAMRALIGTVSMRGVVVIGEGEKDQAPMLYNGEEVGDGTGPLCDVAVDPIDGTTLMAKGMPNAIAVIAVAERGTMFDPSAVFYMEKIAAGAEAADVIDITAPVAENIRRVAKAKRGHPEDVTVCILDRPRHEDLVQAGPRGRRPHQVHQRRRRRRRDLGRPPGHRRRPAARHRRHAGRHHRGGRAAMHGRRHPGTAVAARRRGAAEGHRRRPRPRPGAVHRRPGSRANDIFFCATGITDGDLLRGVRYYADSVRTESIVMRSKSGTIRIIDSLHQLGKAAGILRSGLRPELTIPRWRERALVTGRHCDAGSNDDGYPRLARSSGCAARFSA